MLHSYPVVLGLIAAVLIVCLICCTPSQILPNLEIALDAISVGLPVLAGVSGVPADVVAMAEAYLAAANSALGQASTILAGPGTDAEKAAQILAALASVAQPAVPAQYAAIAQLVNLVATDLAKFIASLPAPAAATPSVIGKTVHVLSDKDRARLAHATSVYNANAAALAKLRGK